MAKTPYKKYPKKADKGPSRTDIEASSIEDDILEFWKAIATSQLPYWNKPWVYRFTDGENAGKYLTTGERYVYTGGFNQFLIASCAKHLDPDRGTLILNRTDMATIFDVKEFGDSPVVKNGIKSIGSIYNRPMEKIVASYYQYPSGARWSGEADKPTKAEIDSLGLTKKSLKTAVYTTFPIWSVNDVYPHLSDAHKEKVDQLIELRNRKGYDFNPNDDFEKLVDSRIEDLVKRQGITVNRGNEKAFYEPRMDDITLPDKTQFKNPIAYLAVCNHEMAHSTKHFLGRIPENRSILQKSIEEVIAETTAVMMIKDFERSLKDILPVRPDIQKMFDDYYASAMSYNHMWGEKLDLTHSVQCIEIAKKEDKGVIKSTLVQIAKAVDALKNGSYTPEQRLEAKLSNYKKAQSQNKSVELSI
jgi:hypothetical protein